MVDVRFAAKIKNMFNAVSGNVDEKVLDERHRTLEGCLRRLEDVKLVYIKPDWGNVDISNFAEWIKYARGLSDPDMIRNCLYCGFQPLYDALIGRKVHGQVRDLAVRSLGEIVSTNLSFLVGYYTGRPNLAVFREGIDKVGSDLIRLDGSVPYRTKSRNIDDNKIYPKNVLSFLKQFLAHAIADKIDIPGYVVGCACGASEIAMPLAGILGVDVEFLRMSIRRHDPEVRVISERESTIRSGVENRNVVCVEDYACRGESLARVMEKVVEYGASSVLGASVNFSWDGECLQNLAAGRNLNLFRLKAFKWRE